MLDAELQDGDLSQITQAIQNALRQPSNGPAPQRIQPQTRQAVLPPVDDEQGALDETIEEISEELDVTPRANAPTREGRPRKYRAPQVLADVDLTTPTSFAEYSKTKNPSSDQKKYLTVAAWFKEHRGVDAINTDHVYTCFRAVKWGTSIEDFQAPLRALKKRQLMAGAGRGLFAINHLGIAEVENLDE